MEWTKEQGESSIRTVDREARGTTQAYNRIGGYRHEAWAIKLQLELTAALSEAQRLREQLASALTALRTMRGTDPAHRGRQHALGSG